MTSSPLIVRDASGRLVGLAGVPHEKNGVAAALDYLAHGGNAAPSGGA